MDACESLDINNRLSSTQISEMIIGCFCEFSLRALLSCLTNGVNSLVFADLTVMVEAVACRSCYLFIFL